MTCSDAMICAYGIVLILMVLAWLSEEAGQE